MTARSAAEASGAWAGDNGGDRRERTVDVLVVGAGPAGLAAAWSLSRAGCQVEVIDREQTAGGVPRHSQHTGFGMRDGHRLLTGPAYARRWVERAADAGATLRTQVTATGWAGPTTLDLTCPTGLERVRAGAVVLATGARERPRSARLVPGSRPRGVYTTGELQQSVYVHHQDIGSRAVIVGAEHVSFSAVLTLAHAGTQAVAMVTPFVHQQSFPALGAAVRVRYGTRLLTAAAVLDIVGLRRVEAVTVRTGDRVLRIPCDTVVFTGDWVPDNELARLGGLAQDPGTGGPTVDTALASSAAGVFAIGNLVHPVLTAGLAAADGPHVHTTVLAHLAGAPPTTGVPLQVASPLRWVSPNAVLVGRPPAGNRFTVWGSEFVPGATVDVIQDGSRLHTHRLIGGLVPQRAHRLPAEWVSRVAPGGGAITITVRSHPRIAAGHR